MTGQKTKPNILFLLGESHAPDLIAALGHPAIQTPNLDRLVARGVSFDNAYCASPLCVPARASIATGKFPHQNRYWESSMAYDGREESWMKMLQDRGYRTAGMGKMHFRSDEDDVGFDEWVETMQIADGIGDLVGALRHDGREPSYKGLWDVWTSRYGHGDDNPYRQYDERIVKEAENWLESVSGEDQPWSLSVHFIAAHAPFVTPERFRDLYDPNSIPEPIQFDREVRPHHASIDHLRMIVPHDEDFPLHKVQEVRAAYYATVTYLDDLVGRVLKALEKTGQADNTLIVYTSDHGFSVGDHFLFGLFHLFEESARVPMIISGPGVNEGTRIQTPVSHVDLLPTLIDGVSVNEQAGSLWPHLKGEEDEGRVVYAEYHACGSERAGYMIRQGPWKLIDYLDTLAQLYHLDDDPEEARNLAMDAAYSEQLAHMRRLLTDIVDPIATDKAARADQAALIEAHGGRDKVLEKMMGFSYSPPPGLHWSDMGEKE